MYKLIVQVKQAHMELTTEHCVAFYDRIQGFISNSYNSCIIISKRWKMLLNFGN